MQEEHQRAVLQDNEVQFHFTTSNLSLKQRPQPGQELWEVLTSMSCNISICSSETLGETFSSTPQAETFMACVPEFPRHFHSVEKCKCVTWNPKHLLEIQQKMFRHIWGIAEISDGKRIKIPSLVARVEVLRSMKLQPTSRSLGNAHVCTYSEVPRTQRKEYISKRKVVLEVASYISF